jgi:hypothetical protein
LSRKLKNLLTKVEECVVNWAALVTAEGYGEFGLFDRQGAAPRRFVRME